MFQYLQLAYFEARAEHMRDPFLPLLVFFIKKPLEIRGDAHEKPPRTTWPLVKLAAQGKKMSKEQFNFPMTSQILDSAEVAGFEHLNQISRNLIVSLDSNLNHFVHPCMNQRGLN